MLSLPTEISRFFKIVLSNWCVSCGKYFSKIKKSQELHFSRWLWRGQGLKILQDSWCVALDAPQTKVPREGAERKGLKSHLHQGVCGTEPALEVKTFDCSFREPHLFKEYFGPS